ncbi:ferrous iron transport protein A, partial [Vibrio parahaemolyticus]|nr:ferrous iron transport protein A [Vibrio parahaemolyticus]
LGDPLEITLRGYELTLRKEEAMLILVQKEV